MEVLKNNRHDFTLPLFDNEKMFESIFKALYPRLIAFATKFIEDRSLAEDIIQGVFLKAWEKREDIRTDTFQAYLFTLVRNACINHIKHIRIEAQYRDYLKETANEEGLYYADFLSDPFHTTIFNEVQNKIEEVMQILPGQTQNVFRLSRFEGLKNTEIATKLNISLRTVEKHNTKALRKMKEHLTDYHFYAIAVLELIKELNQHFSPN